MAHPRHRPAFAYHVLVEVLARSETKGEPSAREHAQRGGLLRHYRWVIAEGGACHERHQRQPVGGLCRGAEHHPGIGRVALVLNPRKEVAGGD